MVTRSRAGCQVGSMKQITDCNQKPLTFDSAKDYLSEYENKLKNKHENDKEKDEQDQP